MKTLFKPKRLASNSLVLAYHEEKEESTVMQYVESIINFFTPKPDTIVVEANNVCTSCHVPSETHQSMQINGYIGVGGGTPGVNANVGTSGDGKIHISGGASSGTVTVGGTITVDTTPGPVIQVSTPDTTSVPPEQPDSTSTDG